MNSTDTETVADVLAEIRDAATSAEAWHASMDANVVMDFADRVETAARRERDHAVEHATRHAEAVARDNCRDCVHNPRGKNYEGGNAAAMREALETILRYVAPICRYAKPDGEQPTALFAIADTVRDIVAKALSAPVRQCDVGTAEEQAKRFNDFCSTHTCNKCVVYDKMAHSFNDGIPERAFSCRLVFSQLPYEAEEGGSNNG